MTKAEYGAVPLAEAKAELVEDVHERIVPQSSASSGSGKIVKWVVVGIVLLLGWSLLRHRGSHGDVKTHSIEPLVNPPPPPEPPVPEDGPPPPPPPPPKSKKGSKTLGPKKSDPKKTASKKGPKSNKKDDPKAKDSKKKSMKR